MTIIYIHGVKVRDPAHGQKLGEPLLKWLGPKIAKAGQSVDYVPVYWGDRAARFRWNLQSRPKTALRRAGSGDFTDNLGALRSVVPAAAAAPAPVAAGPVLDAAAAAGPAPLVLDAVPRDRRADALADLYLAVRPRAEGEEDPMVETPALAGLAAAAAATAERWDAICAEGGDVDDRLARLMRALDDEVSGETVIAQGGLKDWMGRAAEAARRAALLPFDTAATLLGEARPAANSFVAYFLGDVLVYLNERGDRANPGEIPQLVLGALRRAQARKATTGEPIIVVAHSMGGQLLYDAVTCFAAQDPALADLSIDHLFTCGCQVSFFAELGQFREQPATAAPNKLPRPAAIAAWTNYYDLNDLVGFVVEPVFEGVRDVAYDTGFGLAFSHTGFFARPSFFETMAGRLGAAP